MGLRLRQAALAIARLVNSAQITLIAYLATKAGASSDVPQKGVSSAAVALGFALGCGGANAGEIFDGTKGIKQRK